MPSLTLRPAAVRDIDDVLDLWRHAAENTTRPPDSREAVEVLLARDPAALILAEESGAVIGSIIAGWDGWRHHLYRLAVHPTHRRRGIARALLTAAEERLTTLGATRLDAMVLDTNDLGYHVWEASGYARQEDWSRWVRAA